MDILIEIGMYFVMALFAMMLVAGLNKRKKLVIGFMMGIAVLMVIIGILFFLEKDVYKGILALISATMIVPGIGTVNRRIIK